MGLIILIRISPVSVKSLWCSTRLNKNKVKQLLSFMIYFDLYVWLSIYVWYVWLLSCDVFYQSNCKMFYLRNFWVELQVTLQIYLWNSIVNISMESRCRYISMKWHCRYIYGMALVPFAVMVSISSFCVMSRWRNGLARLLQRPGVKSHLWPAEFFAFNKVSSYSN